ncbi:hypothetical protein ACFOY8_11435 [Thalassospira xianhensis]|uniref:Uncharacterized protein n=1 Tax=Thalassospira xianhensis MCCC 1A02616 TaxID=1177929 RepID=A0A367UAF9_9PROT|nr:hypothetical protein [Thalassospira xianhensis]RCK05297.1 hypothetical protein TH5_14765 [Thalassospira xianhensis MCCC 1A02616]
MKTALTPNVALKTGILAAAFIVALPLQSAFGQMFEKPWAATAQNRAQIAVIMKQAESGLLDGTNGATAGASGSSSLTQLVCGGGGGQSEATANSACIILNNSNGDINTGQDSTGDQTANGSTETTTNNADLSDALENISGEN